MITITVTGGERGEGKTTTALRIAAWLKEQGFRAEYRGRDNDSSAWGRAEVQEAIRGDAALDVSEPREFLIVDPT